MKLISKGFGIEFMLARGNIVMGKITEAFNMDTGSGQGQ